MSILSDEFAFEIGDIVYMKTALHTDRHTPLKFMVVERRLQECHGGRQRAYQLCDGRVVPEIMLTKERPPYEVGTVEEAYEYLSERDKVMEEARLRLREERRKAKAESKATEHDAQVELEERAKVKKKPEPEGGE